MRRGGTSIKQVAGTVVFYWTFHLTFQRYVALIHDPYRRCCFVLAASDMARSDLTSMLHLPPRLR
jgi:hypothetical protein